MDEENEENSECFDGPDPADNTEIRLKRGSSLPESAICKCLDFLGEQV